MVEVDPTFRTIGLDNFSSRLWGGDSVITVVTIEPGDVEKENAGDNAKHGRGGSNDRGDIAKSHCQRFYDA